MRPILRALALAAVFSLTSTALVATPAEAGAVVLCLGQNVTIFGTTGDDAGATAIQGTEGNDVILAYAGNDEVFGTGGNDLICGGDGADTLDGGDGHNVIQPGAGSDTVIGNALGGDMVSVVDSPAALTVNLKQGYATNGIEGDSLTHINGVDGSAYADVLYGTDQADTIFGEGGNDILVGHGGPDTLEGDDGDDTIDGQGGADELVGGNGDDVIRGYAGDDTLSGGPGADQLLGGADNDNVSGGAGNDKVYGDYGDDVVQGDQGADLLTGSLGNDDVYGGSLICNVDPCVDEDDNPADLLWSDDLTGALTVNLAAGTSLGEGSDTLHGIENVQGTSDNDTLIGDAGPNILNGGEGNDRIRGGVQPF